MEEFKMKAKKIMRVNELHKGATLLTEASILVEAELKSLGDAVVELRHTCVEGGKCINEVIYNPMLLKYVSGTPIKNITYKLLKNDKYINTACRATKTVNLNDLATKPKLIERINKFGKLKFEKPANLIGALESNLFEISNESIVELCNKDMDLLVFLSTKLFSVERTKELLDLFETVDDDIILKIIISGSDELIAAIREYYGTRRIGPIFNMAKNQLATMTLMGLGNMVGM